MKNKILIDAERTRYLSGISVVCQNLLKALHEQGDQAFSFNVYGARNCFSNSGYPIKAWKSWHRFLHLGLQDYHLIHIFHQSSSYFNLNFKAKKVVTLHDLNFLHEETAGGKRRRNIRRLRTNLQNADVVACISEFVKEDYLKNQHLFGVKIPQQVEVIYNGLQFPDENKVFGLGKFETFKNKNYFLNIGVLFPKKNQMSLLKALLLLEEDLVLVVSGSKKNYEAEVLKFIADHQLENRVHILRNITDDEKYALIQNCEAMLHPSLAEGFGIPPIEAMYCGKPVFLSRLTSLPEIGGPHAFYFDDFGAAAMAEKIKNGMQAYRSDVGYEKKVRSWALQYDYREMAAGYSDLYRRTLTS